MPPPVGEADVLRSLLLLNACQYYDARKWEEFEALGMEAEAFVSEGPPLWTKLGVTERCRSLMSKLLAAGWLEREIERCEEMGVRLITCRDAIYPAALRELPDAPLALYVTGRRIALRSRSLAVVGTRHCSSYGARVSRDLGRAAAAQGWSVVSGGARGVDGEAHAGCLEGGGLTAAVLGTGVDVVYPAEHRGLFEKIRETGMLISEFALGTKGEAWRFPRRNRIVAGLASRTVVVEAPERSGAMITARLAAEAGREVWAVPGRIGDERCEGSNRLIFDGAIPMIGLDAFFGVTDAQGKLFDPPDERPSRASDAHASLGEDEKTLLALLAGHGNSTVDILADEAKMSAAEVFRKLSVMAMRGLICSSGSGRYRVSDG